MSWGLLSEVMGGQTMFPLLPPSPAPIFPPVAPAKIPLMGLHARGSGHLTLQQAATAFPGMVLPLSHPIPLHLLHALSLSLLFNVSLYKTAF